MPLAHISLRQGKPIAYRKAIMDGVYEALRDTFDVPEDDRFMTVSQHAADDFAYGETYLDLQRSEDVVFIQITVSNTRTVDKKQALYREIVRRLTIDPALRPEDIFINLVEVLPENWSFGHGLAQYVR